MAALNHGAMHSRIARVIVVSFGLLAVQAGPLAPASSGQGSRDFGCKEWHECRQMALAAADRGDFETFHDAAWRAIQTGPKKDPDLMFLLARAQTLSGRPHDALITLQRLAEMGKPVDVADDDEFARTRELPGWPEVAALIDRSTHPAPPGSPAPPALTAPPARPALPVPPALAAPPASPALPAPPALTMALGTADSRAKVLRCGGLAGDAVSSRFSLTGDRLGRKLMVVAEGSDHAVGASSAQPPRGFATLLRSRSTTSAAISGSSARRLTMARECCTSCSWRPAAR